MRYATIEKEASAVIFGIKRFRYYLQDKHFLIISDHRPLQWLHNFRDENGKLGRWSILLGNFNYTIRYRPGRKHENADFLSRIAVVSESIDFTSTIREQQSLDYTCQAIKRYLDDDILDDNNPMPIWAKERDLYFFQDGILCRTNKSSSKKRRNFTQIQIFIPASLQKEIMKSYHDSPSAGHLAFQRTKFRI